MAYEQSTKMDRLKELKKGSVAPDDIAIDIDSDKGNSKFRFTEINDIFTKFLI